MKGNSRRLYRRIIIPIVGDRSLSNCTMPKSILTCTLLFAVILLESRALKRRSLAKTIDFHEIHYKIVAINSHLLKITCNESRLTIDPIDDINYKSCVIGKDSLLIRSLANRAIETAVLANERKIVIWSVRQARNFDESRVKARFAMLLVDPWLCTYSNVPLPSDLQPKRFLKIFPSARSPQVITYESSFDVFFVGPDRCSPCRFDENGQRVPLDRQVENDGWDTMEPSYIQALDRHSASQGYFQIYHYFGNFTVAIRRLDANFKLLKQTYLDQMVPVVSVKRGEDSRIGFCYLMLDIGQASWPIICDQLDSELKLVDSVRLPILVRDVPPEFSLKLDNYGRMLVTYDILKDKSRIELVLFMYDTNGRLIESINFGKSIAVENNLLANKKYCLVIVRTSYKSLQCINI